MKRTMCVGMMCVLLLGLASVQASQVLLSAGFETSEGYTAGPLVTGYLGDPGNQQGWYGEDYFRGYMDTNGGVVTTAAAHSGSSSVAVPAEDYYYDFYRHELTPKSSGVLTFQWYQMLEAVTTSMTTTNILGVGALDRLGYQYYGPGGQLQGATHNGIVDSNTPNKYFVYSGNWQENQVNEPGISAQGAWVGYKYVANLDTGTFDLLVDTGNGWNLKMVGAAMANANSTYPNVISSLYFYQIGLDPYFTGTTHAYIDDMLVTWDVPEPATLALLSLGALGLLRRRNGLKRMMYVGTMCVLVMGLGATQADQVLLSAGFETGEGYSNGSLNTRLVGGPLYDWYSPIFQGYTGYDRGSALNQQGWYGEKDQTRYAYDNKGVVQNVLAHTGTQAFKIPTGEDHYDVFYRHPIEEKTTGTLTIQMYVYLEGTGGTQDTWNNLIITANDRFNGAYVAGNEYANLGPGAREDMFFSDYDGYINNYSSGRLHYNRAGSPDPVAVTQNESNISAAGQWIGRKVVIDIDHSTFSHYVDKNNTGTWTLVGVENDAMPTNGGSGPALIDNIAFFQQIPSPTTTGAYVDDVLVTWVPEPATLVLLSLGALGLLRRKHFGS